MNMNGVPLAALPQWIQDGLNQRKAKAKGKSVRKAAKPRSRNALKSSPESGTGPDVRGVDAWLAAIGDGPDMRGFNAPIWSAMLALLYRHGADASDDAILTPVRDRIAEAPRDKNRGTHTKYDDLAYLTEQLGKAREYVVANPKSDDGEEAASTVRPEVQRTKQKRRQPDNLRRTQKPRRRVGAIRHKRAKSRRG